MSYQLPCDFKFIKTQFSYSKSKSSNGKNNFWKKFLYGETKRFANRMVRRRLRLHKIEIIRNALWFILAREKTRLNSIVWLNIKYVIWRKMGQSPNRMTARGGRNVMSSTPCKPAIWEARWFTKNCGKDSLATDWFFPLTMNVFNAHSINENDDANSSLKRNYYLIWKYYSMITI